MAYLRFERILGDQSMPGKQRPFPGVRDGAVRDPRNMARAGLPEAKSPVDASRHPPERRPNRCRVLRWYRTSADATSGMRAMPNEGIQGDELAAYVPLDTYDKDERGIAYGTRVLWRRRSGSSRRRHDLPRRAGKPSAGRSRPGDRTSQRREVGVMPNAERHWMSRAGTAAGVILRPPYSRDSHWRARCWEIWHGGFGPGPLEKDPKGYLASGLPVPHSSAGAGSSRQSLPSIIQHDCHTGNLRSKVVSAADECGQLAWVAACWIAWS
jgi:hypothetical protein